MGLNHTRRRLLLALGLPLVVGAVPASAAGKSHVPASIPGGAVVTTDTLAALVGHAHPVLIDVGPAPLRPADPKLPWLPPPHRSIPGSVWIPGAGTDVLPAAMADHFHKRLGELTGGDRDKPIVVYCHPDCPLSFNAAKRVIAEGYRHVYWYADGIESWQEAGGPTTITKADAPAAK